MCSTCNCTFYADINLPVHSVDTVLGEGVFLPRSAFAFGPEYCTYLWLHMLFSRS